MQILIRWTATFRIWKSVVHASYELLTMTLQSLQSLQGVFGEPRRTGTEWFFKIAGDIKLSQESKGKRDIQRDAKDDMEIKDTNTVR